MKENNQTQIVRKSDRLSVMNTSEDISHILMKEIAGDAYTGKAALYNLARMFLEQYEPIGKPKDNEQQVRNESTQESQALEDVVEYLLIVGSAANRISPTDINQYIQLKNELRLRGEDIGNKPNDKFKQLLYHTILNINNTEPGRIDTKTQGKQAVRFQNMVDELNLVYQSILRGTTITQEMAGRTERRIDYIPPVVSNASRALLINFPILQRIEIRNYKDIISAMEIDMLLGSLDQPYKEQVRSVIESRIDEIVRYRQQNKTPEPTKCTAPEILLQAKIGYIASRGIHALTPRISMKHFSGNYEAAVLSAVCRMKEYGPNCRSKRGAASDLAHIYFNYAFNDRDVYKMYNKSFEDDDERKNFKNSADLRFHVDKVVETTPSELSLPQNLLLSSIIRYVAEKKFEVHDWKEFFQDHIEKIQKLDEIGIIMLAHVAEMYVHAHTKFLDNETSKPIRDRKKEITFQGLGITHFSSRNKLLSALKPQMEEKQYDESIPYISNGEIYFPPADFGRAVRALVATYVNNKILQNLEDSSSYDMEQFVRWNSPSRLCFSYTPNDRLIARELMNRYTIFSKIAPLSPDDITSGIALHVLEKQCGKIELDTSSTITQNLIVWQMYDMNRMAEK